ncbi:MAG: DNA-binding protein [Dehalococcoidia bacterium]|nr:DNA-binding protein [Dehalococcoidia bacterium]MDD5494546.1 DNA-binding protein [Dehalococcoidia bacterium]
MLYTEGKIGRVFVIRLEDDDVLPSCVEQFAVKHNIIVGQAILVGGIESGNLVVGPRKNTEMPPDPMLVPIDGVHEVVGVGVLAPDKKGKPVLHMHAALGRSGKTTTGCVRMGVKTWQVGEVVLYEILGADVARLPDKKTGFELMVPGKKSRKL